VQTETTEAPKTRKVDPPALGPAWPEDADLIAEACVGAMPRRLLDVALGRWVVDVWQAVNVLYSEHTGEDITAEDGFVWQKARTEDEKQNSEFHAMAGEAYLTQWRAARAVRIIAHQEGLKLLWSNCGASPASMVPDHRACLVAIASAVRAMRVVEAVVRARDDWEVTAQPEDLLSTVESGRWLKPLIAALKDVHGLRARAGVEAAHKEQGKGRRRKARHALDVKKGVLPVGTNMDRTVAMKANEVERKVNKRKAKEAQDVR